ncbi:MAG: calcium/sodium antiporter [Phycisphaerae bacterium]|nr:calcium/sodium antiporter [Phycisphaerae bacterium]
MLVYGLMAVGFVFVIKGADLFVSGASALARRLHVSDLAIGLTVVAFGTSLPELAVNVTASIRGDAGITIGNILGSNIANILLILGVAGVILPLAVTKGTVWKEIPLSLLAALLVGILANDLIIDGAGPSRLTRIDGLVLLCFFVIFLYYTAGIARVEGIPAGPRQDVQAAWKTVVLMVAGFIGLLLGSMWVVEGAVKLATALGVQQTVIGLTIVAVGTSLPELATSAAAAYRKNPEIAIGNVVGSDIFNIFFILGVSSLIRPIPFEPRANVDIGAAIVASGLLFACMFTSKEHILDRREAALFLVLYTIYVTVTVVWLN